jgi:hypothetical protein
MGDSRREAGPSSGCRAGRTFAAGQGDTERQLTEVHGSNNCSFAAAYLLVPSARNIPKKMFRTKGVVLCRFSQRDHICSFDPNVQI